MGIEYERDYFEKGNELEGYTGYCDSPQHTRRANKIIAMANPKSVLDAGCAFGYIVRKLLAKGVDAYGIDVSQWCEERAKTIIPNRFIRHDLRQPLPFSNKSFDVIYCEGVLEHIEPDYIPEIMYEFERVAYKRIIQVSFPTHPNASKTGGHVCLQPREWWFAMMPEHTWLFYDDAGTDKGEVWLYKC